LLLVGLPHGRALAVFALPNGFGPRSPARQSANQCQTAPNRRRPPAPCRQEENMVSNSELREKYATAQDYEDDFM
jgi:hypothetical protein